MEELRQGVEAGDGGRSILTTLDRTANREGPRSAIWTSREAGPSVPLPVRPSRIFSRGPPASASTPLAPRREWLNLVPRPPGSSRRRSFGADSVFEWHRDDTLLVRASFDVRRLAIGAGPDSAHVLYLDGQPGGFTLEMPDHESLWAHQQCGDC